MVKLSASGFSRIFWPFPLPKTFQVLLCQKEIEIKGDMEALGLSKRIGRIDKYWINLLKGQYANPGLPRRIALK